MNYYYITLKINVCKENLIDFTNFQ